MEKEQKIKMTAKLDRKKGLKTTAANERFCEMAGYILVWNFCLLLQCCTRANVGV